MDDIHSYSKISLTQDLSDASSIASTSTVNENPPDSASALAIRETRIILNNLHENREETDKEDDLQGLRKRLSSYAKNPRYQKAIKTAHR